MTGNDLKRDRLETISEKMERNATNTRETKRAVGKHERQRTNIKRVGKKKLREEKENIDERNNLDIQIIKKEKMKIQTTTPQKEM